jgi:hypothetical protein
MNGRRNIIWGLVAAAIAVVLILRAFGTIPDGLWNVILRAVPALLIFVGLAVLLRNRMPFGGLVALAVSLAVAFNVGLLAYSTRSAQVREDNRIPIEAIISADVNLLRIEANLLATDVNVLLSDADAVGGEYVGSLENTITVNYVEDGQGGAVLTIAETPSEQFPNLERVGRGRFDLLLPPDLATDVLLDVQQGTSTLDFGNIDLERLNINMQQGDVRLVLPEYAAQSPDVSGNGNLNLQDGTLTLFVPASVGVRLELPTGSGAEPQVDETVYNVLRDGTIETRSFDVAETQVRYVIRIPRGRVRIEESALAGS